MSTFSDKLKAHLASIGWKPYDIVQWFKDQDKKERLSEQYLYALCRGDKHPKDDETLRKLASVPGLGLSFQQIKAWQLMDIGNQQEVIEFGKEVINSASSEAQKAILESFPPEILLSYLAPLDADHVERKAQAILEAVKALPSSERAEILKALIHDEPQIVLEEARSLFPPGSENGRLLDKHMKELRNRT